MSMKEAYQKKKEAELKELEARIDLLKAEMAKAGADQRITYEEQVEMLQKKQHQVRNRIEELRTSSENAWEEVKSGVELAWEDLKTALERAEHKFK